MKSLLLVIVLFLSFQSFADETVTAQAFEQNTNKAKKMFDYVSVLTEKDGLSEVAFSYKDLQGQTAYEEAAVLKGSEFVKTNISQKQTGESATVEVKDGKIIFTKTSADGKTKTETEKLGKTMVMSANFKRFVHDHWKEIQDGKDVDFRYGVWDRMETVGFEIFKDKETTINGEKAVIVKMKPSSFVIAAIVKPIYFTYNADGTKLVELNGRVPVKLKSGEKWKDLDCEVVYAQ